MRYILAVLLLLVMSPLRAETPVIVLRSFCEKIEDIHKFVARANADQEPFKMFEEEDNSCYLLPQPAQAELLNKHGVVTIKGQTYDIVSVKLDKDVVYLIVKGKDA